MNLPPSEHEKAAADGIDIRNHKRRPRMDYDQLEHELKQKRNTNHAKRK